MSTATHSSSPSPSRSRRRAFLFSGAAIVAAAVGILCFTSRSGAASGTAAPSAAEAAPAVTVVPAEQRLVTEYDELVGRVEAIDSVEIRPRVSGYIDEVSFQAGQLVHKGDVLFKIDPRWHKAQADLAAAEVARARAHLETADREAVRAEELIAKNSISKEEAESRRSLATEARATLAAAQASLDLARLDLDYTQVRAPIDGRVSRAFVTAGNHVSGTPGLTTVLTTVVSVGDAYVYADLDEATVLRFDRLVREGRIARVNGRIPVEMALGDEIGFPRRGSIESSDNRLDSSTATLSMRMVFPNPDSQLIPGLFARVRIPVGKPEPELLVSERAIGTDQGQKYVLIVAPDRTVAYRTVTLGPVIDGRRVVREGLRAGDPVIVNGLQRIRPGMTVRAEAAVAESPAPASGVRVAAR